MSKKMWTALSPLALVVAALVMGSGPLAAQQDFSKVEIKTQSLAPGLWMMTGAGGNLAVSAGEDGVFMVDDQYAPLTDKIKAAVAALSPQPLRFVLNTHWHGDHTGGNENLGKAGTLIVAHDNVRARMSTEQFIAAFNSKVEPSPKAALPVVTFNDTVTLHLNGEEIVATHVPPAHTDGDSVVWFKKANVLHMGDCFFNGLYPFIDVSSGGGVDGVIAVADRMLAVVGDDTKVIPGHGPLANKKDLQAFRDMLAGIRAAVAPMVAAGKTLEQVQAAKPTEPWDAAWGKGFLKPEQFAAIVYSSLKPH